MENFSKFKKAQPHDPTPEEKKALRIRGKNVSIGKILFLRGKIALQSDISIKDQCSIDGYIKINSGTVLEEGAILQKKVSIGKKCRIHKGAVLTSGSHGINHATLDPQLRCKIGAIPTSEKIVNRLAILRMILGCSQEPVAVEDDVTVGEYTVILAGVRVGKGAKILSDSVVTKSVVANTVVGGCPAKTVDSGCNSEMFLSKRDHQFKILNPIANSDDPESQLYAVFGKYDLLAQGICVNQISDKKVVFGNDIWVGMNVVLDAGIRIGDGAVIGAGAHVVNDVEPYSVVVGSPARHLKWRFSEEVRNWLLCVRWWDWSEEKLFAHKEIFSKNLNDPCEFKKLSQKGYS